MLEARNVFADDVELKVDLRADFDVVEVGVVVGVGDDAHLEGVVGRVADGETDSIDGDAAFVYTEVSALGHRFVGGVAERETIAAFFALFGDAGGGLVDVPLDDVPIKTSVHHHRALHIDCAAYGEPAEVGTLKSFVHRCHNILFAFAAHNGEADAIVSYALVDLEFVAKGAFEGEVYVILFFFDGHNGCGGFYNS